MTRIILKQSEKHLLYCGYVMYAHFCQNRKHAYDINGGQKIPLSLNVSNRELCNSKIVTCS